jgi:hypothetical protein
MPILSGVVILLSSKGKSIYLSRTLLRTSKASDLSIPPPPKSNPFGESREVIWNYYPTKPNQDAPYVLQDTCYP